MPPGPDPKGHAQFRSWLIEKLKETSWSTFVDEEVEGLSQRLGVRVEVLREAQRSLNADYERAGRVPSRIGRPGAAVRSGGRQFFELLLPREVHEDWCAYCQTRQLTHAVLLRSLIHRLLSYPPSGERLSRRAWIYRGRRLKTCTERRGRTSRYLTSIATEITPGAKQALVRRAHRLATDPSTLVREAVVELLEGRCGRLAIIGTPLGMWDDPDRYFTRG